MDFAPAPPALLIDSTWPWHGLSTRSIHQNESRFNSEGLEFEDAPIDATPGIFGHLDYFDSVETLNTPNTHVEIALGPLELRQDCVDLGSSEFPDTRMISPGVSINSSIIRGMEESYFDTAGSKTSPRIPSK